MLAHSAIIPHKWFFMLSEIAPRLLICGEQLGPCPFKLFLISKDGAVD